MKIFRLHHKGDSGFTLIETLFAVSIVTIAILGVGAVLSNLYRLNTMRNEMAIATFAAKRQLEEIKADTWDNIANYDTSPYNVFDTPGLHPDGINPTGQITVETFDDADDARDVHHVTVRVQWLSLGQHRRFITMETFISR